MSIILPSALTRRDILTRGSKLSLASIALLSGFNTKAVAQESTQVSPQDIDVLNEILGTEHEGIGVYQIVLEGHLIDKNAVKDARLFQGHHKKHRDILIEKIQSLGGTPAVAKTQAEYASDLNTSTLKTPQEALQLIVKLELGAANAYIGMLPSTNDHELAKVAGRIAADEVIHWTALTNLLGSPLPTQALSFGA